MRAILRCLPAFALTALPAAEVPLAFDLQNTHHVLVTPAGDGSLEVSTQGEDPWILLRRFEPAEAGGGQTVLAFEYFCPEGVEGLEVYYGPPITSERQFAAGALGRAESWLPAAIDLRSLSGGKWSPASNLLRLDFGHRQGATLRIRDLRLREPNSEELRSRAEIETMRREKLAREARVNAFYTAKFPNHIDGVSVDHEEVLIQGRLESAARNARLIELLPEASIATQATAEPGEFALDPQEGVREVALLPAGGVFEVRLKRTNGSSDRTTARWAVAEPAVAGKWRLRSHWKYATDLSAAGANDLPRLSAAGVKGMGGVGNGLPLEELLELGVRHITINLSITVLMDAVSHPGWIPFAYGGRTWFVNPVSLDGYDKLAKFCSDHEIIASGIVLVSFADSVFGRMLVHPEADRAGHYAMPNLTNAEGVAAYEAVMEFIARRYAAPGSPHGRIANWIIHNEIGYGWEWTNMGKQPPMLFMEHYLRSMRLVHNITRRHDPHSRVFISLTHHWNTPADPSWKAYSNLDLLNRLAESSRVEGDFAWGVAYHPYPQNLRRPDAWNDTQVTNEFTTPLITPKNIGVLDRWMQEPVMLDSTGRTRGVLLSEQGFNTPDYSEENLQSQAAAFVYMWRQLRGLKTIEAFHNHRWIDHPNEGGLLLGLRKLPENGRAYGDKKPAWEIYKALDTPEEEKVTRFAGEIIGNPSRQ